MSLTRGHSCALCQQRKVRCDQQKPCFNCVRAQVECKVVPPQPARRKKKLHERDLIERLRKYEAIMTQHGIDFNSVLEEGTPGDSGLLQSSYEPPRGSDHHVLESILSDSDGFPFMLGGSPTRITHLHPSPIQIFQLWQAYIDNVNPLLKISHVPTLQTRIIGSGADLKNISKPLEALMFCIYLIAVKSMTDDEVQNAFGETKAILLARYNEASQQALINARLMRSNDLMVSQAFLLYLLSVGRDVDSRSLFCWMGIAVRIATRLGIHRYGTKFGLSPFETEQRNRLWWQIVSLDKTIAEMNGSALTALSSSGTDCRLPLNVNDTDLHPHAREFPRPQTTPTEMVFCLTRFELTIATVLGRANVKNPHSDAPSLDDLDKYCSYIESTYLEHRDPTIPLQLFTLMATRVSLCKLRLIEFMCREKNETSTRDALVLCAIQMLEYDDVICTTESLRGFLWYTQLLVPFTGYIFLARELRQRTAGELCDRAWKAISNNYDHRRFVRHIQSPMHVAFAHAVVKAWDAREEAELLLGRAIEPPNLVTVLRGLMSSKVPAGVATSGPNSSSGLSSKGTNDTPATICDDNIPFPPLDSPSQIYGAAWSDYDRTDWTYLMNLDDFQAVDKQDL